MLVRRLCKVCKSRRFQKEMTEIHKDVYVCESRFWTQGGVRGGCNSDFELIKYLKRMYEIADKITDRKVYINLKPK